MRPKYFLPALLMALVGTFAATPAFSADTAATVNGTAIPESRLDFLVKEQTEHGRQDSPQLREAIRNTMINRELVRQQAVKLGLDKQRDVRVQMDLAREQVLVNAYIDDILKKSPPSTAELRKDYAQFKQAMGTREYHVHQILVKSESEANSIIAQLKKGAKFERLADQKSLDPASRARGGDLGWQPIGRFVKPFADALEKMKKGEVADTPVHSPFGWHVIRLDGERPYHAPSFEKMRPALEHEAQQQVINKAMADLREKAKIQ
jgi:peptidyl-prolyl cis-trans isomerase C